MDHSSKDELIALLIKTGIMYYLIAITTKVGKFVYPFIIKVFNKNQEIQNIKDEEIKNDIKDLIGSVNKLVEKMDLYYATQVRHDERLNTVEREIKEIKEWRKQNERTNY